jgi:NhaP-type Na+/H+ or K+/H+ antiporter
MLGSVLLTLISETLLVIGVVAAVIAGIVLIFWLASAGDNKKNRFGPSAK